MKRWLFILIFISTGLDAYTQDSTSSDPKFTVRGYIKDLQTLSFPSDFEEAVGVNLLHNRINLKWVPTEKFTAVAEIRNRFYWGEQVSQTPGFASLLRNRREKFDLQKTWISKPSYVLHSNIERLYADYQDEKINIRIGRQRINWGVTTAWNANDIFNSYNYLDFDYEERQGTDGIKMHYIFSNGLKTELAYALSGEGNEDIIAGKLSINRWNYDFQVIGGLYMDRFTAGAGWAGYIKDAGFKGELQYFAPSGDSADRLNITVEGDYMFKKGWYVNLAFLFNNHGLSNPAEDWTRLELNLTPENLMPTRWNIMITGAKEITPLISANMIVLYAPGTNLLIIYPTLLYNMATDLDVNLVWQSFFAELNNKFSAVQHLCFLRLKWSF